MNTISKQETLNEFVENYYRLPNQVGVVAAREQLLAALKYAALTQDAHDLHGNCIALYFFARLASLDRALIQVYGMLRETMDNQGRLFIAGIIEFATNGLKERINLGLESRFPSKFDVSARSATCTEDLDYLCAEFFASGDITPIIVISHAALRPDLIRSRIHYLKDRHPKVSALFPKQQPPLSESHPNLNFMIDCLYECIGSGDSGFDFGFFCGDGG